MTEEEEVPVFNLTKTKLKNFSFATSVSSLLFQNFSKEPSTSSVIEKPKFNDFNLFDKLASLEQSAITEEKQQQDRPVKRSRDEYEEQSNNNNNNKKSKIIEIPETKSRKPAFNTDNYRKLNMKSLRFKKKGGGGGQFNLSGAKYKRFLWKKNKKNSNYINTNNYNDDDDGDYNLNLVGNNNNNNTKSAKLKYKNKDDDYEEDEELHAKINNPNNNNSNQKQQTSNESVSIIESNNNNSKKKKSPKKLTDAKLKPAKKSILKEKNTIETTTNNNTNEDDDDDVTTKKPSKSNKKKNDSNENTNLTDNESDIESDENAKKIKSKSKKIVKSSKKKDVIASDSEIIEIVSESQIIQPVFELDSEGKVLSELPDYVYKVLEKDFKHKSFKPHQADAVLRICSGLSTLVVLSTGYGKSLIYQMAARLYAKKYPGSVVLIVSPLISLMQDQLLNLPKCLKAAVCDSTMNDKDYQLMLQDLTNGKINILYMSPEAIMNKKIRKIPRLAFVCIDEVHCLSQWSHNFRPSYLQICQLLSDYYNVKCILGLTATATQQTIEEIGNYFDIEKKSILLDCNLPDNLCLSVSKDTNKDRALIELLRSKQFEPFIDHVIIYCNRREQTEKIAQLLRLSLQTNKRLYADLSEIEKRPKGLTSKAKSAKISSDNDEKSVAEAYHAGLTTQQRRRIQNDFIKGKLRIIVATCAFGMGINMSNIRSVIHYNMPKAIENYVQEIGRAGRDGQLSRVHLFLDTQPDDINEIKKYIHMDGYDHKTIKKLILKIFDCCTNENCKYIKMNETDSTIQFRHQVGLPIDELVDLLDIKEETILTLLCYLQSAEKIKLFNNCYKYCTIKSYKGNGYLNDLAKKNEIVACVLKQRPNYADESFNIDVIQICDELNIDYDHIRPQLKRLEWQIDEYGTYKAKSGISVEFQTKSFYLKRKCILDENELDIVNDHLWARVSSQMKFSHLNFKALYKILYDNSFRSIGEYIDNFINHNENDDCVNLIEKRDGLLKENFNNYFNNKLNINEFTLNTQLEFEANQTEEKDKQAIVNIKKFIYTYEKEAKLTGTVIARIFHGISTPRYPAEVWGRNRNFWRSHLDIEFERLTKLCTQQLLNC